MELDPYRLCPCGSGKKMKFCCSKDILSDLDKVLRAIEGDQRVAALDQLTKLIDAKGARPALLSLKANLQLSMSTLEDAAATIEQLSTQTPNSSVAIALQARLKGDQGNLDEAIEELQRSLEYAEGAVPASAVATAISSIVERALEQGRILAARSHLMLRASLGVDQQGESLSLLLRVEGSPEVFPLLKEDFVPEDAPSDAPWAGEYRAAILSGRRGAWRASCESLISLSEKVPRQPQITRAIAVLRGYLGQESEAARVWHEYAQLPGVPLDTAVEAEALAQYLDDDQLDVLTRTQHTYSIRDFDRLNETLLSDRRFQQSPVDPESYSDDQPPPRCMFVVLDRPPLESTDNLTPENIPSMLGALAIFGRETDREARLELVATSGADLDTCVKLLLECAGEWLQTPPTIQSADEVPMDSWLFQPRWSIPPTTNADQLVEVANAMQRRVLLEQWSALPRRALGGKTPREAAAEPALHIALLGAILSLELERPGHPSRDDFNELRRQLNLPEAGLIDPATVNLSRLPIARLRRLELAKVANDGLDGLLTHALVKGQTGIVYEVASQMMRRGVTGKSFDKWGIYRLLVQRAPTSGDGLKWVVAAQSECESARMSPAQWLIMELSLRIVRGEPAEVSRVLSTLQTRHLKEPGVAQALRETLAQFGLLRRRDGGQEPPVDGEPLAAAEPEAKKIWTPDSASTPAASGQAKSKLWIPGMD